VKLATTIVSTLTNPSDQHRIAVNIRAVDARTNNLKEFDMLIAWFDARKPKEFGASLAKIFIEKIPAEKQLNEKVFAAKAKKALEQATIQTVAFKRENNLNIYKKAQMGNAFKWALKEADFDAEYIDKLTKWLMLQMS
jgi:hypothetical protein